jgi:hypothetical protein
VYVASLTILISASGMDLPEESAAPPQMVPLVD